MPQCPLVIVVGPDLSKLNTFIVSFGDKTYSLPLLRNVPDHGIYVIYVIMDQSRHLRVSGRILLSRKNTFDQ
ncbi:AAEL002379-PA [Aedes aegypti]|uniref:AAEL002379-PA n=1 Tax=Aedes aegypti TaxID=7159 RepID=Q17ID9_AEDAE|nr:AAEL002379-PA [Aedes aegypti]